MVNQISSRGRLGVLAGLMELPWISAAIGPGVVRFVVTFLTPFGPETVEFDQNDLTDAMDLVSYNQRMDAIRTPVMLPGPTPTHKGVPAGPSRLFVRGREWMPVNEPAAPAALNVTPCSRWLIRKSVPTGVDIYVNVLGGPFFHVTDAKLGRLIHSYLSGETDADFLREEFNTNLPVAP